MNEDVPITLDRPLCVFDCEATGLDICADRIVSLAILKLTGGDLLRPPKREWYDQFFNPGFKMKPEVIEIHGITDAMVENCPRFKDKAKEVMDFIKGCDLCTYNGIGFDLQLIHEELFRAGIEWDLTGVRHIDCSVIFKKKEPRDLAAAVRKYCDRSHEDAHSAHADTEATLDVLVGQLWAYPDLFEMGMDQLHEFCQQEKRLDLAGTVVMGKNGPEYTHKKVRGVPVAQDPGYAAWILRSDFPENTKRVLRKILEELK